MTNPPKAPQVSSTELQSFYEAHFGAAATGSFSADFLFGGKHLPNPSPWPAKAIFDDHGDDYNGYYCDGDDDDGLGYYADGVKRTLTDEQIAMFRHSEMEALRRRARARQPLEDVDDDRLPAGCQEQSDPTVAKSQENKRAGDSLSETEGSHKNKKQKTSYGQSKSKQPALREPKPDLRKRTWDVVDEGLDSLDYDDT